MVKAHGIGIQVVRSVDEYIFPEIEHPSNKRQVEAGGRISEADTVVSGHKSDRLLGLNLINEVYVISKPGVQFSIKCSIDTELRVQSPPRRKLYWYFQLYMNGRRLSCWGVDPEKNPSVIVARGILGLSTTKDIESPTNIESRPFFFSEKQASSIAEDGGVIEVKVYRAKSKTQIPPVFETFPPQDAYGLLTPRGKPAAKPESLSFYRWGLVDPLDAPYTRFRVHYRSFSHLKQSGLIPADFQARLKKASNSCYLLAVNARTLQIDEKAKIDQKNQDHNFDVDDDNVGREQEELSKLLDQRSTSTSGEFSESLITRDHMIDLNTVDEASRMRKTAVSKVIPVGIVQDNGTKLFRVPASVNLEGMVKSFGRISRPLPQPPARKSLLQHNDHPLRQLNRRASARSIASSVAPSLRSWLEHTDEDGEVGIAQLVPVPPARTSSLNNNSRARNVMNRIEDDDYLEIQTRSKQTKVKNLDGPGFDSLSNDENKMLQPGRGILSKQHSFDASMPASNIFDTSTSDVFDATSPRLSKFQQDNELETPTTPNKNSPSNSNSESSGGRQVAIKIGSKLVQRVPGLLRTLSHRIAENAGVEDPVQKFMSGDDEEIAQSDSRSKLFRRRSYGPVQITNSASLSTIKEDYVPRMDGDAEVDQFQNFHTTSGHAKPHRNVIPERQNHFLKMEQQQELTLQTDDNNQPWSTQMLHRRDETFNFSLPPFEASNQTLRRSDTVLSVDSTRSRNGRRSPFEKAGLCDPLRNSPPKKPLENVQKRELSQESEEDWVKVSSHGNHSFEEDHHPLGMDLLAAGRIHHCGDDETYEDESNPAAKDILRQNHQRFNIGETQFTKRSTSLLNQLNKEVPSKITDFSDGSEVLDQLEELEYNHKRAQNQLDQQPRMNYDAVFDKDGDTPVSFPRKAQSPSSSVRNGGTHGYSSFGFI